MRAQELHQESAEIMYLLSPDSVTYNWNDDSPEISCLITFLLSDFTSITEDLLNLCIVILQRSGRFYSMAETLLLRLSGCLDL